MQEFLPKNIQVNKRAIAKFTLPCAAYLAYLLEVQRAELPDTLKMMGKDGYFYFPMEIIHSDLGMKPNLQRDYRLQLHAAGLLDVRTEMHRRLNFKINEEALQKFYDGE
jgi:hypothetical protein